MSERETQEPQEPQECMACHGSGQVISNLGGQRSKVTCPWCRGSGTRIPGADAQEYRTLTGTPKGRTAGETGGETGGSGAGGDDDSGGGDGEAA